MLSNAELLTYLPTQPTPITFAVFERMFCTPATSAAVERLFFRMACLCGLTMRK